MKGTAPFNCDRPDLEGELGDRLAARTGVGHLSPMRRPGARRLVRRLRRDAQEAAGGAEIVRDEDLAAVADDCLRNDHRPRRRVLQPVIQGRSCRCGSTDRYLRSASGRPGRIVSGVRERIDRMTRSSRVSCDTCLDQFATEDRSIARACRM